MPITSPLYAAVKNNHIKATELLLEHKANPNILVDGTTPLHIASEYGYLDIMRLLLDYNASLIIPNSLDALPIHRAIAGGIKAFKLLLQYGADMNSKKGKFDMMQMIAYLDTTADILKWFIDMGMDINAKTYDDAPLLHIAAFYNNMNTATMLIDHGIDIHYKALYKATAYDVGISNKAKGHDVANLLHRLMNTSQ